MKITCDICDGLLHMDAGGKTASCSVCGMIHSIERVREKIQQMNAPAEPVAPAEEVYAVNEPVTEVYEETYEQAQDAVTECVCEEVPEEDPFYSTDIFTRAPAVEDDEIYDAECTEVPENLLSVIERVEEELGCSTTVVATGGMAQFVCSLCKREIKLERDLLLKGLNLIYKKNVK